MDDRYVVIECRDTVELVRWGGPDYGLWSPTFLDPVIKGRGQNKRVVHVRRSALPGYAFVPVDDWPEVRRRVPEKFNVSVLEYDMAGYPKCCTLVDLAQIDEILKAEQQRVNITDVDPNAPEIPAPLKRGDNVEVIIGPFVGRTGVIQCSAKKPIVRLLIGVRYVNLPAAMLKLAK